TERNRTAIICMASRGTNRCTTATFLIRTLIIPKEKNNATTILSFFRVIFATIYKTKLQVFLPGNVLIFLVFLLF
ncbi:MAG: hypothetical protein IJP63_05925, partial [Acholeplasmatales bacterium]|nr:hypothetical protein [Acholeplasmatales bacterium]